jgi:hypothetical protein
MNSIFDCSATVSRDSTDNRRHGRLHSQKFKRLRENVSTQFVKIGVNHNIVAMRYRIPWGMSSNAVLNSLRPLHYKDGHRF